MSTSHFGLLWCANGMYPTLDKTVLMILRINEVDPIYFPVCINCMEYNNCMILTVAVYRYDNIYLL